MSTSSVSWKSERSGSGPLQTWLTTDFDLTLSWGEETST